MIWWAILPVVLVSCHHFSSSNSYDSYSLSGWTSFGDDGSLTDSFDSTTDSSIIEVIFPRRRRYTSSIAETSIEATNSRTDSMDDGDTFSEETLDGDSAFEQDITDSIDPQLELDPRQHERERRVFGAHLDVINRIRGRPNGVFADPAGDQRRGELRLFNELIDEDRRGRVNQRDLRERQRIQAERVGVRQIGNCNRRGNARTVKSGVNSRPPRSNQRAKRQPSSTSTSSTSVPVRNQAARRQDALRTVNRSNPRSNHRTRRQCSPTATSSTSVPVRNQRARRRSPLSFSESSSDIILHGDIIIRIRGSQRRRH